MTALGPDVSNWQGTPDMAAVKAAGNDFVICKATEGTGYVDPTLAANRANGHNAGLAVGLYHFAQMGDVGAEVRAFLSAVGGLRPGEFPVLDFERPATNPPAWCKAWLDAVAAATGQRPFIYMNQSAVSGSNWSAVANAGYRLWLARYDGDPWTATPVAYWGTPAMKQYTDSASIPGIAGNVDRNAFYGNLAELNGQVDPDMDISELYDWRNKDQRNLVDFSNFVTDFLWSLKAEFDDIKTKVAAAQPGAAVDAAALAKALLSDDAAVTKLGDAIAAGLATRVHNG